MASARRPGRCRAAPARTLVPLSSVMASASSSAISAACTRLPIMAGRKRLPSSLVQFTSSSGARVRDAGLVQCAHHLQAGEHAEHAIEPPAGRHGVEMAAEGDRRARRRRCLRGAGTCCRSHPARSEGLSGLHHSSSSARASVSSGESARRQLPPSGVGPMRAMSMIDCHSRSALIDGVMGHCPYPVSAGYATKGCMAEGAVAPEARSSFSS